MIMAPTSGIATLATIATWTLYEIAPGAPVRWIPRVDGQLRAREGRIWLTREGDARDYWLEAGAAVPVAAGDVLWASVEGETRACLEMRSAPAERPWWHAWRVLRGASGATSRTSGVVRRGATCDAR